MNHLFKIVNLLLGGKYLSLNKGKFNFKLFLLIFLFSIISKLQMAQCTFSLPPVVCKTALLNLMAYAGPQPGTFTGIGVVNLLGTYYFDAATATPGGPYTITYSFTFPYSCSTSSNIRVVNNLSITPLGSGSPLKYTMTSGTSINLSVLDATDHSNFHWYENGFEVGTGSTLFSVQRMGTFTCIADGPCGTPEKAELEVVCDCSAGNNTYALGHTFTSGKTTLSGIGGPHTTTDYVLGGVITVQKGAELEISNANIDMKPGTIILLENGDGTTNGGKLSLDNGTCRLRGCDKWQGVIVEGNAGYARSTNRHGKFLSAADFCYISDAYIGVYSSTGGEIEIMMTTFSNNNTSIALMDYTSYDYHPVLHDNIFYGLNMHDNFASQMSLNSRYSTFTGSGKRSSFNQMIYLEDAKDFDIHLCSFEGNDFLSGNNYVANAIELSDMNNVYLSDVTFTGFLNSGIYTRTLTNVKTGSAIYSQGVNYVFNNYSFDANVNLDKAIDLDDVHDIILGVAPQPTPYEANRFLGIMNYGVYVTGGSSGIYQYENLFNVNNVGSTSGLGSTIGTALYYNNCTNLEIDGSWMANIGIGGYFQDISSGGNIHNNQIYGANYGFHFKDCDDITIQGNTFDGTSNYAMQFYGLGGTKSYIDDNRFINATSGYGLIISPVQDPIGTGSSSNDNSTAMSIDITCNLFQNNAYGIIGSGDINTQGNGAYTNGNKFDGNSSWDLCWMDFDLTKFDWYKSGAPTADPTVTSGSLTLNGSSISSPSNYNSVNGKTNPACFYNFLMAFPNKKIEPNTNRPKISNTMVSDELRINSAETPSFSSQRKTHS